MFVTVIASCLAHLVYSFLLHIFLPFFCPEFDNGVQDFRQTGKKTRPKLNSINCYHERLEERILRLCDVYNVIENSAAVCEIPRRGSCITT